MRQTTQGVQARRPTGGRPRAPQRSTPRRRRACVPTAPQPVPRACTTLCKAGAPPPGAARRTGGRRAPRPTGQRRRGRSSSPRPARTARQRSKAAVLGRGSWPFLVACDGLGWNRGSDQPANAPARAAGLGGCEVVAASHPPRALLDLFVATTECALFVVEGSLRGTSGHGLSACGARAESRSGRCPSLLTPRRGH